MATLTERLKNHLRQALNNTPSWNELIELLEQIGGGNLPYADEVAGSLISAIGAQTPIPDLTLTPPAGRYKVDVYARFTYAGVDTSNVRRFGILQLRVGGVLQSASATSTSHHLGGQDIPEINTVGMTMLVDVDGAQAIEGVFTSSPAAEMLVHNSRLVITQVAPAP